MPDSSSLPPVPAVFDQVRLLVQSQRWRDALVFVEQALAAHKAAQQSQQADPSALPRLHLLKGNLLRDFQQPGALESYQASLDALTALAEPDHDTINLTANVWTNHGITLLDSRDAEGLQKALHSFDQAIALRSKLPVENAPQFAWGLAAAWMNRADALMRLDGKTHQAEARRSHDEGLQILNKMPEGSHTSLPARKALALMNRGLLSLNENENRVAEATADLDQAIAICQSAPAPSAAECQRVMIGILLNRGILLLQANPKQSWHDAKQVLQLTSEWERRELLTAEASLKARHLLCQSLTLIPPQEMVDDWVGEATDAVDEGLTLVREWPPQDRAQLRNMGYELFRFGLLVYRIWQPHFLSEFILENIDAEHQSNGVAGDAVMHQLAMEAIWSTVVHINERSKETGEPERSRLLPILQDLQETEERLKALRESHLQPTPTLAAV